MATDYSFSEKRNFGGRFFREKKVISRKMGSFRQNYITSRFLHKNTFWINHKVINSLQHFCVRPSLGFALSFTGSTPVFLFHYTKDNVQFFFSSTACGVKPALQLRFFRITRFCA